MHANQILDPISLPVLDPCLNTAELDKDVSLAEKIRTLFREQGITIASILMAIGMVISVLVKALFPGGTAGTAGKPPPKDKKGVKMGQKQTESIGKASGEIRCESGRSFAWHHWGQLSAGSSTGQKKSWVGYRKTYGRWS